jgi:hypothetical protein
MSDKNLMRALRAVEEREIERAPKQHRLRTPECPSLPRLAAGFRNGFTAQEQRHVERCEYCRMMRELDQREEVNEPARPRQRIRIGIDIGWSKTRKSCAVALRGCDPAPAARNWRRISSKDDPSPIWAALFRLDELLAFLSEFLTQMRDQLGDMVLVLDGPIGPSGKPQADRHVDSAFGRSEFYGRMQPLPITSKDGPKYVDVTYQVLGQFFAVSGGAFLPPWPAAAGGQFVYAETNPTVGLALLVPPQERTTLPSRKRPLITADQTFRAKSDWYWHIGAARRVAELLQSREVAQETHHERVAALYCLAVAERLGCQLRGEGGVAAVGDTSGVYVIPAAVASDWLPPLREVGLFRGELAPQQTFTARVVAVSEVAPVTVSGDSDAGPPEASDTADKGDDQLLVLTDNGGFWESKNDWLAGLEGPVALQALDQEGATIRLIRADGAVMWKSESKNQTPLKLARSRGFSGKRLTTRCAIAIPVRLLPFSPVGQERHARPVLIAGFVKNGVVVPNAPLPEGAFVELRVVRGPTELPPDVQEHPGTRDRVGVNAPQSVLAPGLTLAELRRMPREQRQAILAAAAELAEEDYRSDKELTGFDAFGEEERDDDESDSA